MRHLPLITDRDRLAAARYIAEKLGLQLNLIAKRKRRLWISYVDSAGGIISENR